jgi:hypothetical protein
MFTHADEILIQGFVAWWCLHAYVAHLPASRSTDCLDSHTLKHTLKHRCGLLGWYSFRWCYHVPAVRCVARHVYTHAIKCRHCVLHRPVVMQLCWTLQWQPCSSTWGSVKHACTQVTLDSCRLHQQPQLPHTVSSALCLPDSSTSSSFCHGTAWPAPRPQLCMLAKTSTKRSLQEVGALPCATASILKVLLDANNSQPH